jgi:prephenate dehydratase
MTRISYLGPPGSFTEEAAIGFADGAEAELAPLASEAAVAEDVASRRSDFGVIAYYNFRKGLVQECLDLLYAKGLSIIDARRVAIVLAIGEYQGSPDNHAVYSHPKALAQASRWLLKNIPAATCVEVASTSKAAETVGQSKSGLAIASAATLRKYGLAIRVDDIAAENDDKGNKIPNYTDFYVVSAEKKFSERRPGASYYRTMVAVAPSSDKPGLLMQIVAPFYAEDINLAKIHSRPGQNSAGNGGEPQMFYLEVEAHEKDASFVRCAADLRKHNMRVLGSYERPGY